MQLLVILFALVALTLGQQHIGIWCWTWTGGACSPPRDTDMGFAFNGFADPDSALQQSQNINPGGSRWISLGGGDNNAGGWRSAVIDKIISAINSGRFSAFQGIAFDIEEGDNGLGGKFAQAFAAAKARGLQVLVTVSGTVAYGIGDGAALTRQFCQDGNVDFFSPQMYTSGVEPDILTGAQGVQYSELSSCRAGIIPSIGSGSLWERARSWLASQGVNNVVGYIQWQQSGWVGNGRNGGGSNPPTVPPPPPSGGDCGGRGPCPAGQCCSKYGWCGVGADYCSGGSNPPPPPPPPAIPPPPPSGADCGGHGPCPAGQCCSKYGWCGVGAEYCSGGSAPPPPADCGGRGPCPAGQCCSKYGWCGVGAEYCSSSAVDSTGVTETNSGIPADGSVPLSTGSTSSSSSVPGWAAALLAIGSVMIVVLVVLIVLAARGPNTSETF